MVFDARSWLAGQLGCDRDQLELVDERVRSDYRGAQDVSYARDSKYAGRVTVTGPRTVVDTEAPHRTVRAVWPGGSAEARIGPDDEIVW
jgi:hypothetical protein